MRRVLYLLSMRVYYYFVIFALIFESLVTMGSTEKLLSLKLEELREEATELGIDFSEVDTKEALIRKIIIYEYQISKKDLPPLEGTGSDKVTFEIEQMRFITESRRLELEEKRITADLEIARLNSTKRDDPALTAESNERLKGTLPIMKEFDDIQVYLDCCDRVVENYKWSDEVASRKLAGAIRGKAQLAFSRMPLADTTSYKSIKLAILSAYNLCPDALRIKFRDCCRMNGETHVQWATRFEGALDKWIESEGALNDFEKLKALFLKEHFIDSVGFNLQCRLKESELETVESIAIFSDKYANAHGWKKTVYNSKPNFCGAVLGISDHKSI